MLKHTHNWLTITGDKLFYMIIQKGIKDSNTNLRAR